MGYTDGHFHSYNDRYDFEPVEIPDFLSTGISSRRAAERVSDEVNGVVLNRNHFYRPHSIFEHRHSKVLFVIAFLLGLLTGYDFTIGTKGSDKMKHDEKVPEVTKPTERAPMELLGSLSRITQKLWETTFQEDFGSYRGLILDKSLLNRIFKCSDASREKLKRKLMIKLVEAQMLASTQQATFVWVTAGDSSAAAHGNMYSQSYTATMENIAKAAFDAVGINFIARNYAMADIESAPELSLCMESVYGADIDILTWDFGQTESLSDYRVDLFSNRAAVLPSTPLIMVLDSSAAGHHWSRFQSLEEMGLGAIMMDGVVMSHILKGRLPDFSSANLVVDNTSEAIRNFICNGFLEGSRPCDNPSQNFMCDDEGGEPCRSEKYNAHRWCPGEVRYQTSYNPGWRKHFFTGRFLSLFLIDALNQALLELDNIEKQKPLTRYSRREIYESLKTQQEYDANIFLQNQAVRNSFNETKGYLFDPQRIYRERTFCRTALLPSQVAIMPGLREKAIGADVEFLSKGEPVLTFDPAEGQRCEGLNFDYKDYFAIRKSDSGISLKIPSDAEIDAFSTKKNARSEVLIMLCQRRCVSNTCAPNIIRLDELNAGVEKMFITVNEQPVAKAVPFDGCYLLANDAGLEWRGSSDSYSRYSLQFKLREPDTELQISSVILIY